MSITRDDRPTVQRRSTVRDSLSTQHQADTSSYAIKKAEEKLSVNQRERAKEIAEKIRSVTDALQVKLPDGSGRDAGTAFTVVQKFVKFMYVLVLIGAGIVCYAMTQSEDTTVPQAIGVFAAVAFPATIFYFFIKFFIGVAGTVVGTVISGKAKFDYSQFDKRAKEYEDRQK